MCSSDLAQCERVEMQLAAMMVNDNVGAEDGETVRRVYKKEIGRASCRERV